jgi:hypothetical protein
MKSTEEILAEIERRIESLTADLIIGVGQFNEASISKLAGKIVILQDLKDWIKE